MELFNKKVKFEIIRNDRDEQEYFFEILDKKSNQFELNEVASDEEAIFNEGVWVILLFAGYSGSDLKMVRDLMEISVHYSDVNFGFKAYMDQRKMPDFSARILDNRSAPILIARVNGSTVLIDTKPMTKIEIESKLLDLTGNIDLTPVLIEIEFIDRYKKYAKKFNDFDNRMKNVDLDMINGILKRFEYDYAYYSKEQFYKIIDKIGDFTFIFQLVLKDGIVEPVLNVKLQERYYYPYGRFDFIPKRMKKEFDRKLFNLPKYSSKGELEEILKHIFSIFEDIKEKLLTNHEK